MKTVRHDQLSGRPQPRPRVRGHISKRRQVLSFASIAAVCGLLDFGVYHLLRYLGMDSGVLIDLARAMSFVVGTALAYQLNKRLTFDAEGGLRQVGSFAVVYGSGFFAVVALNRLMLYLLPDIPGQSSIAWVGSQLAVSLLNFVMLKSVVFRVTARRRKPAAIPNTRGAGG